MRHLLFRLLALPLLQGALLPGASGGAAAPPGRHYKIVIVNEIPGHYEVISGLLHCLHKHRDGLLIMWSGKLSRTRESGFRALMGDALIGEWREWSHLESHRPTADVLISLSAEFNFRAFEAAAAALRPKRLVLFMHRADGLVAKRFLDYQQRWPTTVLTLSPHVLRSASGRWSFNKVHSVSACSLACLGCRGVTSNVALLLPRDDANHYNQSLLLPLAAPAASRSTGCCL